jgi:adenosylcobinamide-phosphate synthase
MGRRKMTPLQLSFAYAADWLLGDPEWFPHPVRLFGFLTQTGERLLRGRNELLAGAALTVSVTAAGWMMGRPKNSIWQVTLAWTALATRSLLDEAGAVITALENNDIELARRRVARIVGRDTANLDESEIARAVIETLAESACDGIVAPLFWMAVAGVPGAISYKAINTLDSMIGHPEPPYTYFGRAAAKLDDAANYIPARLTALGIALTAKSAWKAWLRDGNKHASPNAGQSEAAMAGALHVRLGGNNSYGGIPHAAPVLNPEGSTASPRQARAAMKIVAAVSGLAFAATFLVLFARNRR